MSPPNLPLRTAIIGLSASAITSWAANAHLPALITGRGRQLYQITALCNSSVEAAKAAIEAYNLPPTTKVYGNPADLAADPDIDVVLCNTRVDKHYDTVVDSIKAGKMTYVEWPVTESVEKTNEMVELARRSGSVVAVGLQMRRSPIVEKVKEILTSGKVGRLLSSEVRVFGGLNDRQKMPVGLKYFGDKKIGGNPMTIGFAHMIDFVQSVVGEFVQGSTFAKTQIQLPENKTFDPETKEIVETFQSNVPDLIVVTGTLPASDTVVDNATLSVRFRRGQPFQDEPALTWSLNCELGEIRLKMPSAVAIQGAAYAEPFLLQVYNFTSGTVEEHPWTLSDEQKEVPVAARSVMNFLYSYAEGDTNGYASLESAARRAAQINSWLESGRW